MQPERRRVLRGLALVALGALVSCSQLGSDSGAKKSQTRLELAKEYLHKGELEAAEAEATKAIGFQPGNEEAYWVRGMVHFRRAYNNQRLLEIDGCLSGIDAEVLDKERDQFLLKADSDFAKATQLAPDYSEAWASRGVVANLVGDHDAAIDHFIKALANPARLQDPGLTRANLGWAYFLNKDHVLAAKELLQVRQFHPQQCVATYRLGRVYFARQEWQKAAEQFLAVDPSCGLQEASFYLMKTRLEQGLKAEAQAAREACLSISPQSCIAAQCRTGVAAP